MGAGSWERLLDEESGYDKAGETRELFCNILRALQHARPPRPCRYARLFLESGLKRAALNRMEWEIPADYDYSKPTCDAYSCSGREVHGPYADIRKGLDFEYHGNYLMPRQMLQDGIVHDIIGASTPKPNPWLVFTAGAMGAGKSHCIRWMSAKGLFPLPEVVRIDPDLVKESLPEWPGYVRHNKMKAGYMTRKESGYVVEIAQEKALRLEKNVWVDGSLRDGDWYEKEFNRIRKEHPLYRIAIIHVIASLDSVLARVEKRGAVTGRFVPKEEILDSVNRVPGVVERLAPYCDFIAHVDNSGGTPQLVQYCNTRGCFANVPGDWAEVKQRFGMHPEVLNETLWEPEVDRILGESQVVLFSKSYCSYCKRIKRLLEGVPYTCVELDQTVGGIAMQLCISRRTGVQTVPQLFVGRTFVGGCSEAEQMNSNGELMERLQCGSKL